MSEDDGTCPTCGAAWTGYPPPEPPVGTWVKDRHGGTSYRQAGGGWGQPGVMPFGRWEAMWEARGPLVACGPWGADLPADSGETEMVARTAARVAAARALITVRERTGKPIPDEVRRAAT